MHDWIKSENKEGNPTNKNLKLNKKKVGNPMFTTTAHEQEWLKWVVGNPF